MNQINQNVSNNSENNEVIWYQFRNGKIVKNNEKIKVDIGTVPVFIRSGTIVPEFIEIGGSAEETIRKPLRLYVALDINGDADGDFYLDDGISLNFSTESEYVHRIFTAKKGKLTSTLGCPDDWKKYPKFVLDNIIDEIIVYYPNKEPKVFNNLNYKLISDWNLDLDL